MQVQLQFPLSCDPVDLYKHCEMRATIQKTLLETFHHGLFFRLFKVIVAYVANGSAKWNYFVSYNSS